MKNLNCGNIAAPKLRDVPTSSMRELTLRLISLEQRVGELEEVAEEKKEKTDNVQCPLN